MAVMEYFRLLSIGIFLAKSKYGMMEDLREWTVHGPMTRHASRRIVKRRAGHSPVTFAAQPCDTSRLLVLMLGLLPLQGLSLVAVPISFQRLRVNVENVLIKRIDSSCNHSFEASSPIFRAMTSCTFKL